jgi:ribosomal protein S12 methylthiotransferase accessory factor YcaO
MNTEKIETLVNELIQELNAQGLSVQKRDISEGFGSFRVFMHYLDTEGAFIDVEVGDGGVRVKATGKIL